LQERNAARPAPGCAARRNHIECRLQIDGAVGVGEHHRLLGRQGEVARGGLVFEISGRRLVRTYIALFSLPMPALNKDSPRRLAAKKLLTDKGRKMKQFYMVMSDFDFCRHL
jgi:hypothetical protein